MSKNAEFELQNQNSNTTFCSLNSKIDEGKLSYNFDHIAKNWTY